MIVILDTNIWLAEYGPRSPLGAVTRLYLQQTRAELVLPEVVRLEVEHNLRNILKEYVLTLQSTHRRLLTLFGKLKEIVLPDMDAIEACVSGIFGTLGITYVEILFNLVSARRSFLQTIDKLPPSDRTQEFKDGVLWADCVELLKRDDVRLVTADKAFYKDREYSKGLASNLASEIAGAPYSFSLLPTLDALVRDFRVEVTVDDDTLTSAYLKTGLTAVNDLLERNGFVLGERLTTTKAVFATEDPHVVYVEFLIVLQARNLAGRGRDDGTVTLKGDCAYHLDDRAVANIRQDEETLRFQEPSGEQKQVRNVYAFAHTFLGHKEVTHLVRQPLTQG
jgi:hypothetical protein